MFGGLDLPSEEGLARRNVNVDTSERPKDSSTNDDPGATLARWLAIGIPCLAAAVTISLMAIEKITRGTIGLSVSAAWLNAFVAAAGAAAAGLMDRGGVASRLLAGMFFAPVGIFIYAVASVAFGAAGFGMVVFFWPAALER